MKFYGKLQKHTWKTARSLVKSAYPELADIIDEISPDDKFSLYTASYPYGAMVIDKGVFSIPNNEGNIVPLEHKTITDELRQDLNFHGAIPVSLVLNNSLESFMEQGDRVTPCTLFKKGDVLALWRVFDESKSYQQAPFWRISSGSRAICMLPKITDQNGYKFLKKKYNLPFQIPKNLIDHWHIFSFLANHADFGESWSSEILFFSRSWFLKKDDSKWFKFYHYLLNKVWQDSAFTRNKMIFDYYFSLIQEKRNLKPNPYLADTVSHLMSICSGEASGFTPARDNTAAPITTLQRIFVEDYRLKKYSPVIMHPHHLSFQDKLPIYYSFEIPTTMRFSPKSNNSLTTMTEIKGVKHLIEVLFEEIKAGNLWIERTPLFDLAKNLNISFFHNEKDASQEIYPAKNLSILDKSLSQILIDNNPCNFPEWSPFFRGCIRISQS